MDKNKKIKTKPVIFGEVVFDCFESGEKVLGGAPFNVAWHLQNFGAIPLLISAIGKDEMAGLVRHAMDSVGMDQSGIQIKSAYPTGHVNIRIEDGEPHYAIVDDVAFDHINCQKLPASKSETLLYHGTLATRSEESHASLVSLADSENIMRLVDVNLRDPWWQKLDVLSKLKNAEFVKLNKDELALLSSDEPLASLKEQNDLFNIELAKSFKQQHQIGNLIVTLGEHGAALIDAANELIVGPAPKRSDNFVDAVGAGDAFTSVFILGVIEQWSMTKTLERAQEFASFVVTQRGATCSDRKIYQDFIAHWKS